MLTNLLLRFNFTRDDITWFWSRLVSAAILLASGMIDLSKYFNPTTSKVITVASVVVLWISGKYDSSSLPGKDTK